MTHLLKKRQALIETFAFFDIFDFPLKEKEAEEYMLYKKWTSAELKAFTAHEEFLINDRDSYYFRGRAHILKVRKEREIRAQMLINRAQKYVRIMQWLPFVRNVSICNNLSFGFAYSDSDIDLFIIAEKNRLFLARFFVLIFTQLLGIRRHGYKVAGRFCLSFMVSKEQLCIEQIRQSKDDIYLAFWMRFLIPLIGYKAYEEFIAANTWTKYFFTYPISRKTHLLPESKFQLRMQKFFELFFSGKFGDFVENHMKKWQKKRAQKKADSLPNQEGTIISDTVLKFHDMDMRKQFTKMWRKRLTFFERYLFPSDSEIQTQDRSPQSRSAFGSHSPSSAYTKNETPMHHSQK